MLLVRMKMKILPGQKPVQSKMIEYCHLMDDAVNKTTGQQQQNFREHHKNQGRNDSSRIFRRSYGRNFKCISDYTKQEVWLLFAQLLFVFFPLVALLAHGIMFVRRLDVSLMVVWVVNLIFIPFILQYEDAFLNFDKKIHIRNFLPDGFSLTAHFANNETTKYADKMCKVLFC